MKIIFDLDGTLTDFNQFIQENAINYFHKKYHMEVMKSDALEIEDIFDIQNVLENSGYSIQEADSVKKQMLDRFWISHRFIKFSLLNRFRPGVREYINYLKKQGFIVEIHTSRSKTCEDSLIGMTARAFTIWQCRLNGVFLRKNNFFFYPNDKEKVESIIRNRPMIVFDDKKQIIDQLEECGVKTICVSGVHNKSVLPSKNIEIIHTFDKSDIERKTEKLVGRTNLMCHKREADSVRFFRKISVTAIILRLIFRPMVLHSENILCEKAEGIIYAPNHRSTLDPLIIESVFTKHIHWAALARFFKGEDSIFNNSKNSVLCNITKNAFHRLEYFPIERKSDNPNANNTDTLKEMNLFLKNGYKIGIFAEGTTKRAAGEDFGTFDNAFLHLAKRNKAWIQPITLLWTNASGLKPKVIVNFGEAFQVNNMSIDESMKHFLEIQKVRLEENYTRQNRLKNNYIKSHK